MLSLRTVSVTAIQPWLDDFRTRSHNADLVPPQATITGIFSDTQLAGYFITSGYEDGDFEINHGYLCKEFRHKDLSKQAMVLLEQRAKEAGFKKVILASSRTLKAYVKFMADMGYSPSRVIFTKNLGD